MKATQKMKILIPDGESFFALSVINCLSVIENIEIHVIYSSNENNGVQYSNKINSFTRYKQTHNEIDFVHFLKHEIERRKINVLMPLHVYSIKITSKYRSVFEKINIKILAPNLVNLDAVYKKSELSKYLTENNFPFPKTINDVKKIDELNFPVLYKPAQGTAGGFGIKLFKKKEDIIKYKLNSEEYVIQEYLTGYDIDCNVLCMEGKILAYTIQKGILPSDKMFGPPNAVEFLHEEKLFEMMERLFKKLNWTGVANVDLIFDEVDNDIKLIEINPRFWGSVEASNRVGVNFPYLYCLTAIGYSFQVASL